MDEVRLPALHLYWSYDSAYMQIFLEEEGGKGEKSCLETDLNYYWEWFCR